MLKVQILGNSAIWRIFSPIVQFFPPGHQFLLPRCGGQIPCGNEDLGTLAEYDPLTNRTTGRYLRTLLVQGDLYGQQLQEQSFKT